ncbi:MAG: peptidoglycan DD-metalloendopeptidase family protein [Spirochaetales bacterium]|nr:peptidoglycan DD-metalloendopeptidase family protein [Spirochaetales bacterium]
MDYVVDKTAIIFSFLLNISFKGGICLLISIIFYVLAKERSPKLKHTILFTAILSFIFIPIVSQLINYIFLFLTTNHFAGSSHAFSSPVFDTLHRGIIEIPRQAEITALLTPAQGYKAGTHWSIWFLLIWGVGFFAMLLRVIVGKLSLCYLNRTASSRNEDLEEYLQTIKQEMGIKRNVRLLFSHRYQQPAAFSWIRPTILLPKIAKNWSYKQLRPVLIHELTHISRFDCLTRDITQIVCSLFWFIPFVWIAYGKLKDEQEKISDTNVITFGSKPTDYAEQILFLAKDSIIKKVYTYAFIPIITKQLLQSRIEYVLRIKSLFNKRISNKLLFIFSLCSLLLLIPISTINPFVMESDVEILAELKNTVCLEKSMNISGLPYEIKSNLKSFPVVWPVLEGLGDAEQGKFIDDNQSMRIQLSKWDYGIVIAVAEGIIKEIRSICNTKYGIMYKVIIEHKNNIYSVYSPVELCENNIKVGDRVCQGDLVGYFYKHKSESETYYSSNYYKKYIDFALIKDADYINPLQALLTFNKRLYIAYEK